MYSWFGSQRSDLLFTSLAQSKSFKLWFYISSLVVPQIPFSPTRMFFLPSFMLLPKAPGKPDCLQWHNSVGQDSLPWRKTNPNTFVCHSVLFWAPNVKFICPNGEMSKWPESIADLTSGLLPRIKKLREISLF